MQKITVIKEFDGSTATDRRFVKIKLDWGGETSATLWESLCDDCGLNKLTYCEPWHDVFACLGCGVKDRRYIGE